jgi:hypothetical protein
LARIAFWAILVSTVFRAIPEIEAAQWIMLTCAPDAVSELSFPVSLFLTAGCAALV